MTQEERCRNDGLKRRIWDKAIRLEPIVEILDMFSLDVNVARSPYIQRSIQQSDDDVVCLFIAKTPEDLQSSDTHALVGDSPGRIVALNRPETDEPETFAWHVGNDEIPSCMDVVQLITVFATIEFRPRRLVI